MSESIEIKMDGLFTFLMSGDECGARVLVQRSLRAGESPDALLRDVMFPLAVEAEKLHQANQIDPASYAELRRRLHRLAEEVRGIHEEIHAACGTSGQFVEMSVRGNRARARVIDSALDSRRAQIVAAEIRGAIEVLAGRATTLVLDFSSASMLTSASLGLCMHVRASGEAAGIRVILYGLCSGSARLIRQLAGRAALLASTEKRLERLLRAA